MIKRKALKNKKYDYIANKNVKTELKDDGSEPLSNFKHENFVNEYITCLSGKQSAIAAGYKEKSSAAKGSQILHRPEVQKRLLFIQAEINSGKRLEASWLIDKTVGMVNKTGIKDNDRLNALTMLMKCKGMFVDKLLTQEIKPKTNVKIDFIEISRREDAKS